MAGKAGKAAAPEAEAVAPESPAKDASKASEDVSALKTEVNEPTAVEEAAGDVPADTADADNVAAQPAPDASHDDLASLGSAESDDKQATLSPSKKSTRSKKSSRSSRGKSANSKRSSEEQEAAKVDATGASEQASLTENAASAAAEPSGAPLDATGASGEPVSVLESAAAAETSMSNNDSHSKPSSANKELSQLGLGSFGDSAEDEVVGPRRSRRGPGASPDPKAYVPKAEPGADETSLQDPAPTEAAADEDGDAKAAEPSAQDSKAAVEAAPEGETNDSPADPKVEAEEENGHALDADAPVEPSATDKVVEEGELDFEGDERAELDGDEAGDEGVTRCVCGSADENVGLMIQCETCKCWQHCVCMGMQVEEDCPDVYFCEQCRPELHIPLLRSLGLLPKTSKKGHGKGTKYSARELKEAKEAIAMLAQENARRTQAAEAAAAYNSRDRKGGPGSRNDAAHSKDVPKSPKRRSTMNSRDSAYSGWEPIPPGLLADGEVWDGVDDRKGGKKRKRGLPDDAGDSTAETPEAGESADAAAEAAKRRRMSAGDGQHGVDNDGDADMDEEDMSGSADQSAAASRDKSKKKKGNNQYTVREASFTADSATKPRHPNQYTYRNKDRNGAAAQNGQKTGSSSTSNLTSHSPSPSPSKGRVEHARRAAARDVGSQIGTPAPGEGSGSGRGAHQASTMQLGLPEHLTHLSYLLPNANSRSRSSKPSGSTMDNTAVSGKKGASSGSGSSAPSPPAGSSFPTPFEVLSSIGSSTKVRFPTRRMTMGEMRKRVRNIGEYVTRSQIEAVEREKRMKLLGIVPLYMEEMEEEAEMEVEAGLEEGDVQDTHEQPTGTADPRSTEGHPDEAVEKAESNLARAGAKAEQLPLSMRLMEELTRELIKFQRKFGVGPGSYGNLGSSNQSATVS